MKPTKAAAAQPQNPSLSPSLTQDRPEGGEDDVDMDQPQPTASDGSRALGVARLCIREVISFEDSSECGNGEAASLSTPNPYHQPFPLRNRLTVSRDTMP